MKIKRLAALILSMLMCLSMISACSGGTAESEESKVSGSSETSSENGTSFEANESSNAGTSSGDLTWETADLSWKKNTEPVTMTCYLNWDWYVDDTFGDDDVSKQIIEDTGVNLEVTKGSDPQQILVLLAAGELPDLIFTDNQVTRYMSEDQCYPWDELISEYCPEFMDLIDPAEIVNNTRDDGHFYTLRSHYPSASDRANKYWTGSNGEPGLYLRTDLMEALGNPKLESVEDFKSILAMAKEKYPDLIPYLPHPTWQSPFCEFYGFESPTAIDYEGDQAFIGISSPHFKDWLQFMNSLVQEGYVNVEGFTYEPEQFFQIVRSGSVFSASYNCLLSDETNQLYYDANGMDARLDPVLTPLTHDGIDEFHPILANAGWASLFISKNCETPDRAILLMEYLKSPYGDRLTQWGIEGVHYNLTEDGLLEFTDYYKEKQEAGEGVDMGIGPWYFQASSLGESVKHFSNAAAFPEYTGCRDLLVFRRENYDFEPVLSDIFIAPEADSDEMVILTKLIDLWNNSQIALYSSTDFEATYNEFMANCEQIGIEKLNEWYTQCYHKALKKYEDAGVTF